MVDFTKLTDKAKDLADKNRDRIEDLAEKGVAKYEQKTGRKAPSQVTDAVERIDPDDDPRRVPTTSAQSPTTPPRRTVNTTPERV